MTYASLSEATEGFKEDAGRTRIWNNGGPTESYTTTDGKQVPSVQKFLADKDAEINRTADGILAQANDAAAASEESAAGSATSASNSLAVITNLYYGNRSAGPATRPDGTAMQAGDRYVSTT